MPPMQALTHTHSCVSITVRTFNRHTARPGSHPNLIRTVVPPRAGLSPPLVLASTFTKCGDINLFLAVGGLPSNCSLYR